MEFGSMQQLKRQLTMQLWQHTPSSGSQKKILSRVAAQRLQQKTKCDDIKSVTHAQRVLPVRPKIPSNFVKGRFQPDAFSRKEPWQSTKMCVHYLNSLSNQVVYATAFFFRIVLLQSP